MLYFRLIGIGKFHFNFANNANPQLIIISINLCARENLNASWNSFLMMEVSHWASLQAPKKRRLPIWDYFVISDDESLVKCCSCNYVVAKTAKYLEQHTY